MARAKSVVKAGPPGQGLFLEQKNNVEAEATSQSIKKNEVKTLNQESGINTFLMNQIVNDFHKYLKF